MTDTEMIDEICVNLQYCTDKDREVYPWDSSQQQKAKRVIELARLGEKYEQLLADMKERKPGEWNRITKRPMDAEEREFWEVEIMGEIADEDAFIYENLPEEGEEVLVCTQFGRVFIDSLCCDEGCYFEDYGEMDGIVAWMPLPKPYKEVEE